MWEAVPGGEYLPSSVIKGRTRQITAFVTRHGRMPVNVFELEAAPRIARMLLLSACDGQQATLERADDAGRALLRLQLPTRPDPRSYKDWTWISCPVSLPPTVPAGAVLHLPTLRLHRGRVRADLAYTHAVPKTQRSGHAVALGVDWGLNTLLSAGAARLHGDGTIAALGVGGMFRAAGVLAKQHRLRRLSEHLHAKADHYQRLIGEDEQHALTARHQVLAEEIRHVSGRRSNLNDALARAAARWAVDQALATGASVIYVEDLRSMEARGMGRTMNTRLSQSCAGRSWTGCGTWPPRWASPWSPSQRGTPRSTALSASSHCGTARPPTGPPLRAGSGPCAAPAAGRATATRAPGGASPPAASPTRPRPSPTAPAGPWSSAQ